MRRLLRCSRPTRFSPDNCVLCRKDVHHSFSTPGMPGAAAGTGLANFQTTTPVGYSYNWVGSLIGEPLVNTASDIRHRVTWSR
jgi:hypothetical protein